jgi:hypothetical protein
MQLTKKSPIFAKTIKLVFEIVANRHSFKNHNCLIINNLAYILIINC